MFSKTKYGERVVKGIKLLLVVVALCATTSLLAANLSERIDVSGRDITVRELLDQIEQQTDYTFAFNKSDFDTSRRINIDAKHVRVEDVLKAILKGTQLFYTLNGNQVIIFMVKEATPDQSEKAATDDSQKKMTVIATAPAKAASAFASTPAKAALSLAEVAPAPIPAPAPAPAPVAVAPTPTPVIPQPTVAPVEESGEIYVEGYVEAGEVSGTGATLATRTAIVSTPEVKSEPATVAGSNPASEPSLILDWLPNIPVSPLLAVKTNLLFDATTTMNLGLEVRVSPKSTIELTGNYNPWSWKDNRKWKSIVVQPEYRWWLGDPFTGHFIGTHIQWSHYNFGNLPLADLKTNRYQGDLYGVGVSYGYSWYIGKRWALEATVGLGYNYMEYEKFDCIPCGNTQGWRSQHYFGITKLGLNLSFLIK